MQLEFLKTVKPNRILQILSKPRGIQFCKITGNLASLISSSIASNDE